MLCEFLGSKSDPSTPQNFPSKHNRCLASGRPDKLPLDKQSELCLTAAHSHCPIRLKAKANQFSPPLGTAEALPPSDQEQIPAEVSWGGRWRHRPPAEEVEDVPPGNEFDHAPLDFDNAEVPEEKEVRKPKRAKNEPPSQPFRHEMEDWMRGLFKDLRKK